MPHDGTIACKNVVNKAISARRTRRQRPRRRALEPRPALGRGSCTRLRAGKRGRRLSKMEAAGLDCTTETSVTFSSQFFDFCRAHGAEAWAVSSHPAREVFRDGTFTVENRPKPFADPRGLLFHLNQILYGLSIMWSALRYGADVLIVDSGTTHWFVLSAPVARVASASWPRCTIRIGPAAFCRAGRSSG